MFGQTKNQTIPTMYSFSLLFISTQENKIKSPGIRDHRARYQTQQLCVILCHSLSSIFTKIIQTIQLLTNAKNHVGLTAILRNITSYCLVLLETKQFIFYHSKIKDLDEKACPHLTQDISLVLFY